MEQIAEQNRLLREQVQRASSRLSELNERNLRRVGADLHDGPAQHIGLVALRLDALRRAPVRQREKAHREVSEALNAALAELRQISRGLVLPELDELPLKGVLERAIESHERRTHGHVERQIEDSATAASGAAKICLYRFVQEGLNNAFRHGGGLDQRVTSHMNGDRITVQVRNRITVPTGVSKTDAGIGLSGLRDRVESLGGSFDFKITAGGEALLEMELSVGRDFADE